MIRYADDTTLIVSERTLSDDLRSKAEGLLKDTTTWFSNNQLIINPAKTQFLLFGKGRKGENWSEFAVSVDGKSVYPSDILTLLGVTLDYQLSYSNHMSNKLKKAGFALKLVRNVINITSPSHRTVLVHSYVLPHLLYCCSLFSSLQKCQVKRINRFLKVISRSLCLPYFNSIKYEDMCMKRSLSLLHQALHTGVPPLFAKEVRTNNSGYHMRSATRIMLPKFYSACMANSILVQAAKAWNSLPSSMEKTKAAKSLTSFKNALNKTLNIV
jgi:hypothetical protein